MARGGTGLLGNRGFWLGFALAGGMDVINGVHGIFPSFPALKPTYDATPLFTTKPWNAIGWTPVAVYPFVVGLGYFLPLNLSFSAWFFHLFWKSELIFRNAAGIWSVPGPYRSFETAGAWIVLAFVALWGSRKYLKQVAAWTIRGQPPETTADEPMTYRTAVGGLLVGGAILVLALSYAGMTPWIAILFLLIYTVYALAIARIRAETGPPAHDAEWIGPEMMLLNSLGARTVGQQNIALFSRTYWMSRAYRSHPVGHQLEGFKIAQTVGASSRGFLGAMVIAIIVGTIAGFWVFLDSMYRHGALNVYHLVSSESFRRLEVWLENPLEGNDQMLMDVGLGAGITIILTLLHQRFVGFPFHPVGYAVACGWVLSRRLGFTFLRMADKMVHPANRRNSTLSEGGPLFCGPYTGTACDRRVMDDFRRNSGRSCASVLSLRFLNQGVYMTTENGHDCRFMPRGDRKPVRQTEFFLENSVSLEARYMPPHLYTP